MLNSFTAEYAENAELKFSRKSIFARLPAEGNPSFRASEALHRMVFRAKRDPESKTCRVRSPNALFFGLIEDQALHDIFETVFEIQKRLQILFI